MRILFDSGFDLHRWWIGQIGLMWILLKDFNVSIALGDNTADRSFLLTGLFRVGKRTISTQIQQLNFNLKVMILNLARCQTYFDKTLTQDKNIMDFYKC